jgi:hypothetical protein
MRSCVSKIDLESELTLADQRSSRVEGMPGVTDRKAMQISTYLRNQLPAVEAGNGRFGTRYTHQRRSSSGLAILSPPVSVWLRNTSR